MEGKVSVEEVVVTDTPEVIMLWLELNKNNTGKKYSNHALCNVHNLLLEKVFAC